MFSFTGKTARHLLAMVVIGALATAVILGFAATPGLRLPLQRLNDVMYDSYFKWRTPENRNDSQVVIVAIDDKSLDLADAQMKMGWPWRRQTYSFLIQFANQHGCKAVAFDFIFSQSSLYNFAGADDQLFADAIKASKIPVIIGSFVKPDGSYEPFAIPVKNPLLASVTFREGVARSYDPYYLGKPSLALQTLKQANLPIAGPENSSFLLHYYGPSQYLGDGEHRPFRYVSAWNLVGAQAGHAGMAKNGLEEEWFKDKIMLVGGTSAGIYDLKSLPVSDQSPGCEIQATAMENLEEGRYVRPVRSALAIGATMLVGMIGAAGSIFPRRVWAKLMAAALVFGVSIGGPYLLFRGYTIHWLAPAAPMSAGLIAIVGSLAWVYLLEDRDKRLFVKALSQYVSPAVAADLEVNRDKLKIESERREMTVMFTDISGFTDLSEKLQPEQLSELLRFYFGEMTACIWKVDGTLDKFVGDAIVCFWNPPIAPQPDHAIRALRAAIGMRQREMEVLPTLREKGGGAMYTRIGLNSGWMSAGIFGSDEKFNYTVMGDSVNLASRLEAINKFYHTRVMISHTTAEQVKSTFLLRKIDVITVKGKTEPMAIYEPLAEGLGNEKEQELARRYEAALALYQAQKWDDAEKSLKEIQRDFSDDGPASTLLERIVEFRTDPPPGDWDGVYRFKVK
jgi:adenylate cyclase